MTNRGAVPNPFDSDVVVDPGKPSETDVPDIHREAFDLCRRAYEGVVTHGRSWSILLYGQAGCGKTHLLARFRKWLAGELGPRPVGAPSVFVSVRMETGPGHIWRHLRRRFAEELLRPSSDGLTALDGILSRFAARNGDGLSAAFDNAPVRGLSNDLMRVFEYFAAGSHRRLCRAWLAGDGISDADRLLLNLPQPSFEGVEEDLAEYEARRIVLAIARLCAPAPVVFCFDQIEALGLSGQTTGYAAFSRMGASLVDDVDTGNSLVISTVLVSFLQALQNASMTSDYQRIGKDSADLEPLDFALGKQLIEARLRLVPELAQHSPIAEDDLRTFFRLNHGQSTPRQLIHEARRLFARQTGRTPEPEPQPTIEEYLREQFERLWSESQLRSGTNLTDEVLAHGLPVALQLLGGSTRDRPTKLVDFEAGAGPSSVQVAFGNHTNSNSLARWLKQLQQQQAAGAQLCVIRDARLTIPPTAKVSRERLQAIAKAGGKIVRVDAEALAALDAMRRLLSVATSGDLNLNGREIAPGTVREWLARNLPKEITSFAEEVAGKSSGQTSSLPKFDPDALLELLKMRKVVPLEEAARLTNSPREKIESYARTNPSHVGLFGGAQPVVCQATSTPARARGAANGSD